MMTIAEIRDHTDQLQGRLETERRKIERGHYSGPRSVNLALVHALEGRVTELLAQCEEMERAAGQSTAAVFVPGARPLF